MRKGKGLKARGGKAKRGLREGGENLIAESLS